MLPRDDETCRRADFEGTTLREVADLFRMAYAAATRHLGWGGGIGAKEIERIKAQVARNVNARFSEVTNHVS